MGDMEKRKYPRIGTHNLVSYLCLDDEGQAVGEGMGRTLNVSEGGILLETHIALAPHRTVSLTIALEDEIMELRGKVAFSKRRDDGKFETGVEFLESDNAKIAFLKQYITIFRGDAENP
ncbi:MAG: PilZ domain-containing protein [Deltaproteobacteria bacterium]|nr:PilZ domain-containing protein [Deltaproteobacteria bacterium]